MNVDVIIEDARWAEAGLAATADRAVGATLDHLALHLENPSVSLLGCDDARIAVLNAEFRDIPTPTNVLSWPSEDLAPDTPGTRPHPPSDPELGDIALAFETCTSEAEAAEISLRIHATHLVIHGTLHLLGYDHETDSDADLMEATEIEILAALGVQNPYER